MQSKLSPLTLLWRLIAISALVLSLLSCPEALGSGPRWITGPPYFNNNGIPVAWYTTSPQYFTDPGALSPYVDHAAADALVARAAAVWNVPTASLVLTQGGALDEHVSAAVISANNGGLTFPADVQAANYGSKQIAVIYDADGSVTDLLLGAGASDPSGCRQAGVTENVDAFSPGGQILHALLIVNGRCTGPDPDQQTQLQYQLMRAFGRVLGFAWSQTNDNVFTGSPTPTAGQLANWPVMHPIDLLCGPYTFKCMQQPFVLRPDDLASLGFLYPIDQGQATNGKQDTLSNAIMLDGWVSLGNGQGMEGVNVTVRRKQSSWTYVEDWQSVSAVSGYPFRGQTGTPVTAQDGSVASSMGSYDGMWEGYYRMIGIPLLGSDPWETVFIATEPINPLYTGEYALAPYSGNTITPSGDPVLEQSHDISPRYGWLREFVNPAHAAAQCSAASDGTPTAPLASASDGWWDGMLCGYGHAAWNSLAVRGGRTLTIEVTALDEHGVVTMNKAMPVLAAWGMADDPAAAPTMGSSPAAFNSLVAGMTTLTVRNSMSEALRFVISDERGAGRPDFSYQARVLYADTIAPANVPTTGGSVTIRGMGFRNGMSVLVRGVPASITSLSSTTITASVPSLRSLGLTRPGIADVTVLDPSTGGSSVMTGALGYASSTERLEVTSVPSGNLTVGLAAPAPFSVHVVASDGTTPVAGESVTFAAAGSQATWSGCHAATCTVLTDAQGVASMTLTPSAAGALSLSVETPSVHLGPYRATATIGPDLLHLVSAPSGVQTTGWAAATSFAVKLTAGDGVTPRVGQTVTFTSSGSSVLYGACGGPICSAVTDNMGVASTGVTLLTSGQAMLTATAGDPSLSAVVSAAPASMQLVGAPSGVATIGLTPATAFKVRVLAGDGVTPVSGEPVAFMATGGGIQFGACGASTCTVLSDASGFAATTATPSVAGAITLSAAAREGSVRASLSAGPEVLRATQTPSGAVPVGTSAATPFTVQLLQADGISPIAASAIQFSLTAGVARWTGCAALPCTVSTDSAGRVSGFITPLAGGVVTLTATAAGSTQTATINAVTAPNVLQTVSIPAGAFFQGDAASQAFAVRILTGDGSTGVAGQPITFTADSGAIFAACGAATCTLATDSTGLASTAVVGVAAGPVRLAAVAAAGTTSATITVLERTRSLTMLRPEVRIAEGTPFSWTTTLSATDTSSSTAGLTIRWSAGQPVRFASSVSSVSAAVSSMPTSAGPLGAGVHAQGTACAWTSVCATVTAVGVSGTEFHVSVIDGGAQDIALAEGAAPIHLRVTDSSGVPVAGATVTVRQTVTASEQACAELGRCGSGAVLHATEQMLRSDIDGLVEATPDMVAGVASLTSLTASTGTQGFVTTTLQRRP